MHTIHSDKVASITDLKKNPSKIIKDANGAAVAILNHNSPEAYLVPRETFNKIVEALEDRDIESLIRSRLSDGSSPISVDIDEL